MLLTLWFLSLLSTATYGMESSNSWRISPLNPVRDLGRMDYERCGALHNQIVERGWIGGGHPLESLNRTTYWERWNENPLWPQERLDSSVVEFFKLAIFVDRQESFFWTVHGLADPCLLFGANNQMLSDDEDHYLLLYNTGLICGVSHPAGIVFDQHAF